jgi:hypothetical protein
MPTAPEAALADTAVDDAVCIRGAWVEADKSGAAMEPGCKAADVSALWV